MYGNIIQYDSATFDSSNEVIYVSVRSVSIKSVYSQFIYVNRNRSKRVIVDSTSSMHI